MNAAPVPEASWWTAVVLTGGSSSRMGRDKASLEVGGATMLAHTLAGIPHEVRVVVAGPEVALPRPATFVREDPPGGGPVAGLQAALSVVQAPAVVVLATDLPLVGELPSELAAALADADGAVDAVVAVDAGGRLQHLCAAYRSDPLRDAIAAGGAASGASMRSVLERLRVQPLPASEAVHDVDTPADLDAVRETLEGTVHPKPGNASAG
jgi:molybdopterin-guanine dinucleotide biosynthesis protein A